MKRDVGRLGEKTLSKWATQVGLTINKANEDATGWDYYVEFPVSPEDRPDPKAPLDLEKPPIKCYVQVKSTDGQGRKIEDKLDNWIHHVEDTKPRFFLAMEFGGQNDVQRAFLIHVGEKLIRRVKKRLRNIDPDEASVLHKKRMQFTFSDDCAIEPCDGDGFINAVRSYVGDDQDEYVAEKIRIKKEVGYEDLRYVINVTVKFPADLDIHPDEYLVESSLGLRPPFDVTHFELRDVRFGLPSSEPKEVFEEGQFAFQEKEPWRPAELKIRSEDHRIKCELMTDLYIPKGIGHLVDKKYIKYLCKAPLFYFVYWPKESEANFQIQMTFPSPTETHDLFDLVRLAKLIECLSLLKKHASKAHVEIKFEEGHLPTSNFNPSVLPDIDEDTRRAASVILNAWTVAKYFDIHQGLSLTTGELLQQGVPIVFMAATLTPEPTNKGVTFSWSEPFESPTEQRCVPILQRAILGPFRITLVSTLLGIPAPTGEIIEEGLLYKIEATSMGVFRRHLEKREETSQLKAKDLLDSVIKECDKHSIECIILPGMWDE